MKTTRISLTPVFVALLSTIGYCTLFWFVNNLVFHQPPIMVIMTSIGAGLGTGVVVHLEE